jgi:hypothetical protein
LIEIENNIIERSLAVFSFNVHWQYIVGFGKRPIRVLDEVLVFFIMNVVAQKLSLEGKVGALLGFSSRPYQLIFAVGSL